MQNSDVKLDKITVGVAAHSDPLKRNKGITLIALIITIIVMLILVGVTINVALNGGLFEKAETAARETEKQAIYEQIVEAMILTDSGQIDVLGTYNGAKASIEAQGKTVSGISNGTFTVQGKYGTYTYTITTGKIEIGGGEEPLPPGDFQIKVTEERGKLKIVPILYTEDEAAQIVAGDAPVKSIIGETTVTNLEELILAVANNTSGTNYEDYDTMIEDMRKEMNEAFETPQDTFVYMMGEFGAEYETVEEYAAAISSSNKKTLKINGTEVTSSWEGNIATYTVSENGTYKIELELDGKTATASIAITDALEYPIAYGGYDTAMVIETSAKEAVSWLAQISIAVKGEIKPCTDLQSLSSFNNQNQVLVNESNIVYSQALIAQDGSAMAVWSDVDKVWYYVFWASGTGATYYVTIIGENPLNLNEDVTQEQIDTIMQAANATSE